MHRARGARRGPGAAAVLAAVLAAGPALAWSPAPAAAARPGPAALAPPLGTSVLSVRRLPGWLQATVASQQLTRALAAVTSAGSLGAAATTTCLEVDQGSSVLFELHPEMELVPASNLKLFTAVAAMAELGPDYHFTTSVEATAAPAGGIVTGDLFLVGGGDPLLRTPDFVNGLPNATPLYTSFTQLAAEVHAAGVTEITGG
ncbi:MAG: D-alanyl-D-alanine carboxypeptidase, partial [Acidimicrobiales bacterium]